MFVSVNWMNESVALLKLSLLRRLYENSFFIVFFSRSENRQTKCLFAKKILSLTVFFDVFHPGVSKYFLHC